MTKLEASAVTPKIHNLIDHFDKQLESAMEDLKFLIYESTVGEPEEENPGGGANHKRKHDNEIIAFTWYLDEDEEESEESTQQTNATTTPTEADAKLARIRKHENRRQRLLLREYLQQTCFEAVSALLQVLKAKMDHLGVCVFVCSLVFFPYIPSGSKSQAKEPVKKEDGQGTPEVVDKMLFIGRLCRAIADQSVQLPRIFQEDPLNLDSGVNRKKRKRAEKGNTPLLIYSVCFDALLLTNFVFI